MPRKVHDICPGGGMIVQEGPVSAMTAFPPSG